MSPWQINRHTCHRFHSGFIFLEFLHLRIIFWFCLPYQNIFLPNYLLLGEVRMLQVYSFRLNFVLFCVFKYILIKGFPPLIPPSLSPPTHIYILSRYLSLEDKQTSKGKKGRKKERNYSQGTLPIWLEDLIYTTSLWILLIFPSLIIIELAFVNGPRHYTIKDNILCTYITICTCYMHTENKYNELSMHGSYISSIAYITN